MSIFEQIKQCCGTTCDREAILRAMEKPKYCVIHWDINLCVTESEGPYTARQASNRARTVSKTMMKNNTNGYTLREEMGDFVFTDRDGVDVKKIITSQLIPNGTRE